MIAMTLMFIAGLLAGSILTIYALLEFIRHESRRVRRRDARTGRNVADYDAVPLEGHTTDGRRRRTSASPRAA